MAQKNAANRSQVLFHGKGVGHDGMAGSRIEEVVAVVRFNESGEPMFSKAHQLADTVFAEYRDLHLFLL